MNKPHSGSENKLLQNILEKMIYAGAFFGSLGLLYSLMFWTKGNLFLAPARFFWPILILNLCNTVIFACLLLGAWLLRTQKVQYFKICYGLSLALLAVEFLVFMASPNVKFGWSFLALVLFVSTLNALVSQQAAQGKPGK